MYSNQPGRKPAFVWCAIPCCRRKPTSPRFRIIDEQPGPVVPAGHSYGGAFITEAASHKKVAALGKIAAFVPDAGPGIEMRSHSWALGRYAWSF